MYRERQIKVRLLNWNRFEGLFIGAHQIQITHGDFLRECEKHLPTTTTTKMEIAPRGLTWGGALSERNKKEEVFHFEMCAPCVFVLFCTVFSLPSTMNMVPFVEQTSMILSRRVFWCMQNVYNADTIDIAWIPFYQCIEQCEYLRACV